MSSVTRAAGPHRGWSLIRNFGGTPWLRGAGLIAALTSAVFVTAYALWYTSSGLFPVFPGIQNDYVDLGQSFLSGELSLLERPDPQLAELGNPYEYSQRKGIPFHWDASYYDGKYYLYWGPAPALVSAALQALGGSPPSASLLVDLAYIGLMGAAMALLFHLSQAFGAGSRLTVWVFILIAFFNLPMLFTIGQPRHYQTSIMYGQFFLLLGLLGVVRHTRNRGVLWLPLSGLAWGLAFASRYNLAISIAVYLVFAAFWLWRDRKAASFWGRLGLLMAPLALCLLGLGLYNLARFDDPLETGLTYQLTIPELRQISYSQAYVPSGLYSYLLYPLTGSQTFPFIRSAHFRPALLPQSLYVPPERDFDQIIFGLIPTVPATWLLAITIPVLLATHLGKSARPARQTTGASPLLLFYVLAMAAAGQAAFLLVFFYVAERYLVDFFVPGVLCLAIIVWRTHAALPSRCWQIAFWTVVLTLTLWTAAIGYFACFGVPVLVSLYYDPQMIANLAAFWNHFFGALRFLLAGGR